MILQPRSLHTVATILTLIGALVVTHAMLRRLTSWRCIIIIIIIIIILAVELVVPVSRELRMVSIPASRLRPLSQLALQYHFNHCTFPHRFHSVCCTDFYRSED